MENATIMPMMTSSASIRHNADNLFDTFSSDRGGTSSNIITGSQFWSMPSIDGYTFSTSSPTNVDMAASLSSAASCAVFDFTLYTVIGGSLCVFGIVGNILSFVVLQLQRGDGAKSSATTLLLRALAVADSLVLVVAVPLYALTPVAQYIEPIPDTDAGPGSAATTPASGNVFKSYYNTYPSILPYLWPLYLMPYTATVWLTVLVSADRYAAVCRPFRSAASKFQSGSQTCRQILCVCLFAVVYNIPRFFEYQRGGGDNSGGDLPDSIETASGTSWNSTAPPLPTTESPAVTVAQPSVGLSEFGENKVYRILYANVLYFIVMHGGPILLLAFLNARLITALKAQDRKRKLMNKGRLQSAAVAAAAGGGGHQLHQQQQQNQDLTLTLVVVVFVFIICQTPTFIDHVLWTVVAKDQTQCGHWHYYYTAIGDVLAIFNSSVNFVVYVVASPKFRRGLVDILCRRLLCRLGASSSDKNDGARTLTEVNRLTTTPTTASTRLGVGDRLTTLGRFCRCGSRLNAMENESHNGSCSPCDDIGEYVETIIAESPNAAFVALHAVDCNLE